MNWGKGIVLGLSIFMLFIITLAVMMFKSPTDDFDKDYYEKGLAYDQEYTQKRMVIEDQATPKVNIENDHISIKFIHQAKGEIVLRRPSDHLLDRKLSINQNEVNIPTKELKSGEWKIIMKWGNNYKDYLYEQNIILP